MSTIKQLYVDRKQQLSQLAIRYSFTAGTWQVFTKVYNQQEYHWHNIGKLTAKWYCEHFGLRPSKPEGYIASTRIIDHPDYLSMQLSRELIK